MSSSSGERTSSPYTTESIRRAETYFCLEGPISGILVAVSMDNLSGDKVGGTVEGAAEAVGSKTCSFTLGTEAESSTRGS